MRLLRLVYIGEDRSPLHVKALEADGVGSSSSLHLGIIIIIAHGDCVVIGDDVFAIVPAHPLRALEERCRRGLSLGFDVVRRVFRHGVMGRLETF
jgi:hypothetical protein